MRHLFNCIDEMAVLPTEFGKKLNFSDVCHDVLSLVRNIKKKKRRTGFSSIIVISPFQSIIRDQVSGRGKFYGNDSL